ncbi:HtrA2 peptidase [Fibrisoma limi BUZ 3]|uniref:HtrA2 peptidase n=1 Tax=Fibrisoma limi BUZ 3 TaxID=1185876 RepID=I2GHE4_9BACT|nr:alpha/beta fold hydrolase [Fibrisoma limi]CCH53319.1 HtrA2 peptidase [Fibrisoma limi BUZ 3]
MKRVRVVLPLLFVLSAAQLTSAQQLKKRGVIGVVPAPVSEAIARYVGLPKAEGVLIQQVVPNTTAERIGIQEKDVLTKVNGQPIKGPQELIAFSQKLTEGDAVSVTLIRDKKEQVLSGKAVARANEVAPDLELVYDEFPFQNGYIRALVKRQKGTAGKKQPVVYFIQGASCMTMGYLPPVDPYRMATDQLARKGYAVYMVEKPGMGDCDGTQPCAEIGFNTELAAFQKGYEKLLTLDWVDKDNVFIFGHSLGGIVAPLLAEQFKPRGVVVYGTVLRSWHDYMIDILRDQRTLEGIDYAEAEVDLQRVREPLFRYFYQKKSPDDLVKENPALGRAFAERMAYDGKGHLFGRHYSFWQELNEKNLYDAWKKTDAHVLAIYGEADIAALKPDDHVQIANVVNRYHPGKGEYFLLPKTDHGLVEVGSLQEFLAIKDSPEYEQLLRNKFNTRLIDKLDLWMKEKSRRS